MRDTKRFPKPARGDPLHRDKLARPDAVQWQGTGGSPLFETDDFFADWHGYGLHVEQMGRGRWWWAVYLPGETSGHPGATAGNWYWSTFDPAPEMSSRSDAMKAAEVVARTHRAMAGGTR